MSTSGSQEVREGQGEAQGSQTGQEVTEGGIPPPAKRMRTKIKERDIPVQVKPKSSHLNLKQIVKKMQEMNFHRDLGEPNTHSEQPPNSNRDLTIQHADEI